MRLNFETKNTAELKKTPLIKSLGMHIIKVALPKIATSLIYRLIDVFILLTFLKCFNLL
jgi:hypothetical protein